MPSKSDKQHRFMTAVAHSPSFAKKVGVSQKVGQDFTDADQGGKYDAGHYHGSVKRQYELNKKKRP